MSTSIDRLWGTYGKHRFDNLFLLALCFLPGRNMLSAQVAGNYWHQNVAILDMRTRTVSCTAYVREIVLFDFNKSEPLSPQFGFGPDLFSDNGLGFDLRCNDGVYTSENAFPHNSTFPYNGIGQNQTVTPYIIIDENFLYRNYLENVVFFVPYFSGLPYGKKMMECSLKYCACPNHCICYACEWGSANWCLDWCNCDTTILLRW